MTPPGNDDDRNAVANLFRDSLPSQIVITCLLIVLSAFAIYSNTFSAPFLFDDQDVIVENESLHLNHLSIADLISAGFSGPCHRRPIANITFALNYYIGQHNVIGYHVMNILIHACCGILLYFFLKTTLSICSKDNTRNVILALSAALIWLVHPVQTQAVTYIVQRMTSLSALFYLLSLLLYAKGRIAQLHRANTNINQCAKWVYFPGCIISGVLAIGSKEIAATLPLSVFLYEWYFFQGLSRPWLKRNMALLGLLAVLLLFIVFSFLGVNPIDRILSGYARRDFTLVQRLLTESRVVVFYISLIFFPHPDRLNIDHDIPLSNTLFDPSTTFLALSLILGIVLIAFITAKKDRFFSFCLVWYLVNLVIESSVIGLEIAFEHRNYLPSMLLVSGVVVAVYHLFTSKRIFYASVCLIVVLFASWTYERNTVWRNEITFWEDSAKKSPLKARPRMALGNAILKLGNTDEAISHYRSAIEISSKSNVSPVIFNNLGVAYMRAGRKQEGIQCFRKALSIDPAFADAVENYKRASR